ncbi:MAG TPA: CHRD domain-containing protein, partial [Candidatus Peribacteria bacterium]|nr:CHRD domain-containing protein [Candidatus Peribacteria bacterium]
SGAYYEGAANALVELGALDGNEASLRPGDLATRAELAKLMVNLRGETMVHPTRSSFTDVSTAAWYFPFIETAAKAGWIKGDNDCYVKKTTPCTARPGDRVNRAEAATLLVRLFALEPTDDAPAFMDNPAYEWYYANIQAAADHCVLQGDSSTGLVRPASYMNRAEMITMFHRGYLHQSYGTDCGQSAAEINSVTTLSASKIRVTFSDAMDETRAENITHYNLARASDRVIVAVSSAVLVNDRTVDLQLRSDLALSTAYILSVRNLLTKDGALFNATKDVIYTGVVGKLTGATAPTAQKIRLTFDTDLDTVRVDDAWRYAVTRVGGGTGTVIVATATRIDNRTVELTLAGTLLNGGQYRVDARDLSSDAGVLFTGDSTFTFNAPTGQVSSVVALSGNRIRLTTNTTLDRARAEEVSRYSVSDGTRTIGVQAAYLTSDNKSVELVLSESLRPQRNYTVTVQGITTMQGVSFNGTGSTVYATTTGTGGAVTFMTTLNGAKEVPATASSATGSGSFWLSANGLQYDITVKNMSGAITGAHFHQGAVGVSGPVIVPITFNGNHATGTWTNLTTEQRNWILDGNVYVNVHTATYPNGEIRGQLNP